VPHRVNRESLPLLESFLVSRLPPARWPTGLLAPAADASLGKGRDSEMNALSGQVSC
jgi:hypothetical protein